MQSICEHRAMERLDSRPVYTNAWMTVREDRVRRPDGSTGICGVGLTGRSVPRAQPTWRPYAARAAATSSDCRTRHLFCASLLHTRHTVR